MNYASPVQRAAAFVLDFVFLTTVCFSVAAVLWTLLPHSEVKYGTMLSYRESDFRNYFITTFFVTLTGLSYNLFLPLTRLRGTLGQRTFGVYLGNLNGDPLRFIDSLRRLFVLLLKFVFIATIGPVTVIFGGNFAASWLGLAAPVLFIMIVTFIAWGSPEGAGIFEKAGGFRYFSRESLDAKLSLID